MCFGVMCGCEFIMKDVYLFDKDVVGLNELYCKMYDVYVCIFLCFGFEFCVVVVDSGLIGGNFLYEFYVIVDIGEDVIVYCLMFEFVVNVEVVEVLLLIVECVVFVEVMEKVVMFGKVKCEVVVELLLILFECMIKLIVFVIDNEGVELIIWFVMLCGDYDLNEIKVLKLLGLKNYCFVIE